MIPRIDWSDTGDGTTHQLRFTEHARGLERLRPRSEDGPFPTGDGTNAYHDLGADDLIEMELRFIPTRAAFGTGPFTPAGGETAHPNVPPGGGRAQGGAVTGTGATLVRPWDALLDLPAPVAVLDAAVGLTLSGGQPTSWVASNGRVFTRTSGTGSMGTTPAGRPSIRGAVAFTGSGGPNPTLTRPTLLVVGTTVADALSAANWKFGSDFFFGGRSGTSASWFWNTVGSFITTFGFSNNTGREAAPASLTMGEPVPGNATVRHMSVANFAEPGSIIGVGSRTWTLHELLSGVAVSGAGNSQVAFIGVWDNLTPQQVRNLMVWADRRWMGNTVASLPIITTEQSSIHGGSRGATGSVVAPSAGADVYLAASGWDGPFGVTDFLLAARKGYIFRLYPDRTQPTVWADCILEDPLTGGPELEFNGMKRIRLTLRVINRSPGLTQIFHAPAEAY